MRYEQDKERERLRKISSKETGLVVLNLSRFCALIEFAVSMYVVPFSAKVFTKYFLGGQ